MEYKVFCNIHKKFLNLQNNPNTKYNFIFYLFGLILIINIFSLQNQFSINCKKNISPADDIENLFSSFSDFFGGSEKKHKKSNEHKEHREPNHHTPYKCLNIPNNPKGKKINLKSLSLEQKNEYFKNGSCNPVVLIPGIFGSKLEFVLKDCKEFTKYHKNLMDSCGWPDCENKDFPKKFKIWLEVGAEKVINKFIGGIGDFMSFFENGSEKKKEKKEEFFTPYLIEYFDQHGKKIYFNKGKHEECFGNLFRLYYSNDETAKNGNKIKVDKMKGAEIKIFTENMNDCGSEAITDFGKPFGEYLGKDILGYQKFNQNLAKLGYVKGLSLFNSPYDFRYQISEIIPRLQEIIKLAYKINKKKVIVIGHSYGGLLAYKLSTMKEKELIKHSIVIGGPFLGSFQSIKNTFGIPDNFSYLKNINIFNSNIGKIKTGLPRKSMDIVSASFNLLQFFPKDIIKDQTYPLIHKINELENLFLKQKEKNENENLSFNHHNFLEILELNENQKEILKKYYTIFPKPTENCKGISEKINSKDLESSNNLCKLNFFEINNKNILNIKTNDKNEKLETVFLSTRNNTYTTDPTNEENKNEEIEKDKKIKDLLLNNKNFKDRFELMNKNVHEYYKLDLNEFVDYLISSQEKELFANYEYPGMEFTFIYSSSQKTTWLREEDLNSYKEISLKAIPGDNQIHTLSAIYPGLKWLLLNLIDPEKYKYNRGIHFVEYCSSFESNDSSSNKNVDFEHKKNQFIPLKCECMDKKGKAGVSLSECSHAAMINDKYLIDLVMKIILSNKKSKFYISKDEEFKKLYDESFKKEMFCENLKDSYERGLVVRETKKGYERKR